MMSWGDYSQGGGVVYYLKPADRRRTSDDSIGTIAFGRLYTNDGHLSMLLLLQDKSADGVVAQLFKIMATVHLHWLTRLIFTGLHGVLLPY